MLPLCVFERMGPLLYNADITQLHADLNFEVKLRSRTVAHQLVEFKNCGSISDIQLLTRFCTFGLLARAAMDRNMHATSLTMQDQAWAGSVQRSIVAS
jgi:hypothetical protein